jgi:DnaK suppressor protein
MDDQRARKLIESERARLEDLLQEETEAAQTDRAAVDEPDGFSDPAEPLTSEARDDAIVADIREQLAALQRAELRLAAGTYGKSIRSGRPIADERLEADPAAELTVDEAAEA